MPAAVVGVGIVVASRGCHARGARVFGVFIAALIAACFSAGCEEWVVGFSESWADV